MDAMKEQPTKGDGLNVDGMSMEGGRTDGRNEVFRSVSCANRSCAA
jgi:hypothetical protein